MLILDGALSSLAPIFSSFRSCVLIEIRVAGTVLLVGEMYMTRFVVKVADGK